MADDPAADPPPEQPRRAAGTPAAAEGDAVLARRVQMLATEHWGLLAARGTAQSEVLTRITIFLTLVSAGLVTIGLLGQASGYAEWFSPAMLAILAFVAAIGLMTQLRVIDVGSEDMMYVVGMNRLRGGYVDLDPQVVVNACVDGLLVGAVVVTLTGAVGWAVAAGVVAGLAWVLVSMWLGYRDYREAWRRYVPRRSTGEGPGFLRD